METTTGKRNTKSDKQHPERTLGSRITELDAQGRFLEAYTEYRGPRDLETKIDVNMRVGGPFIRERRY